MGKENEMNSILKFYKDYYSIEFSDGLKEKLFPLVNERKLKKDDILTHIGSKQSVVYFVASGILRDYYIDIDGNDVTRFFLQKGNICGSDRLLVDEPSPVCTEALTDCVLLEISVDIFKRLISENAECQKLWLKCLEYSLVYKIKRENSLLTKNATERYIDFKHNYPQLESRVLQKHIASYLGITPVSLSRIRRTIVDNER